MDTHYQTWSYPTISKWFQAVGVAATAFEMNQIDNPQKGTWGFSYVQQRPVNLTVVTTLAINVEQVHAQRSQSQIPQELWEALRGDIERRARLPSILANFVRPRRRIIDLCIKVTTPEAPLWDLYKHELRRELNELIPQEQRKIGAAKELVNEEYLQSLLVQIRDEFFNPPLRDAQIIAAMLIEPPQDWSAWDVLGEVI